MCVCVPGILTLIVVGQWLVAWILYSRYTGFYVLGNWSVHLIEGLSLLLIQYVWLTIYFLSTIFPIWCLLSFR